MEKIRARVYGTRKFVEVTTRREIELGKDLLVKKTPAYTHIDRKTVSGVVYEPRNWYNYTFKPTGKNAELLKSN